MFFRGFPIFFPFTNKHPFLRSQWGHILALQGDSYTPRCKVRTPRSDTGRKRVMGDGIQGISGWWCWWCWSITPWWNIGLGNLWNKSLTWLFRPFWGSDSLTFHHHHLGWPFPAGKGRYKLTQTGGTISPNGFFWRYGGTWKVGIKSWESKVPPQCHVSPKK